MPEADALLLLGEDHLTYGEITCRASAGGGSAVAITVGASADTPSAAFKRDRNEDAALLRDDGRLCLLAVADGHRGRYASHTLVEGLAALDPRALAGRDDPRPLLAFVAELGDPAEADRGDPSGATLLVALLDREAGTVSGVSFGDSSFVVLAPAEAGAEILTEKTPRYVSPADPGSLAAHGAVRFRVDVTPGQLLLAFTDGVDECHYGRPETSIGLPHLVRLLDELGAQPEAYARRLLEMALAGVDGNPGGEDNAAVVVVRV